MTLFYSKRVRGSSLVYHLIMCMLLCLFVCLFASVVHLASVVAESTESRWPIALGSELLKYFRSRRGN